METKELLQSLWNKGVRGINITWDCGGDSGSIDEVELIPDVKDYNGNIKNDLRDLGWDVYNDFDGRTDGNFSNVGKVEIVIKPHGKYYAKLENSYEDQEEANIYNEKTEDYDENPNYQPELTVKENITI